MKKKIKTVEISCVYINISGLQISTGHLTKPNVKTAMSDAKSPYT